MNTVAYAGILEEYQKAKLEYINAIVCLATYNDRIGQIARTELLEEGWQIKPYKKFVNGVDTKFYFVENDAFELEHDIYILAITGTESFKDLAIDLNFNKIYFGGTTPEQFAEQAKKQNLTSKEPMVHRGFHKYTQTAFFSEEDDGATYGEYIADVLKGDSKRKLYLVGHSLGGAVATLGAARLISLGVDPAQLEVITFGAPAVGNQAFADQFGSQINLTRVVIQGDPVRNVLQNISGGYAQFGSQEVWRRNRNVDKKRHSITVYLDSAIRNYYDVREEAKQAGVLEERQIANRYEGVAGGETAMVYVAPLVTKIDKEIAEDQFYMEENYASVLRTSLPSFLIAEGQRGALSEEFAKAKQAGCKWMIIPEMTAKRISNQKHEFYVSFQEDLYAVEEQRLVGSFINANSSKEITPIEASLQNVTSVKQQRQALLKSLSAQ